MGPLGLYVQLIGINKVQVCDDEQLAILMGYFLGRSFREWEMEEGFCDISMRSLLWIRIARSSMRYVGDGYNSI